MPNNSLKIIVDRCIPFLENLSECASVVAVDGDKISREIVSDADALIVRTRTRCDRRLLEGTKVSFIATATIGTDHIDVEWCRSVGIEVTNAPGCNAPAVAQYVFSSLVRLINRPLSEYRLGIVGVGYVGRTVERWASSMGMEVMLCDPPRQSVEGGNIWSSLEEIASWADIITFHTPLTCTGKWPTYHMADRDFFAKLRRAPIIVNAARGPVVDSVAWLEAIDKGRCGPAVIDCWEGEPTINMQLLERAAIATPHIAGYSAEGKWRASQMVLDAICKQFDFPPIMASGSKAAPCARFITPKLALSSYNPLDDTSALKSSPADFERLRNTYPLRSEISLPSSVRL